MSREEKMLYRRELRRLAVEAKDENVLIIFNDKDYDKLRKELRKERE